MSDEIPEQTTGQQFAARPPPLLFEIGRFDALVTNECLFLIYHLHRWQWHECGVYTFLTSHEHVQIACTCYAAWMEYSERRSDDEYILSPIADNGAVPFQTA